MANIYILTSNGIPLAQFECQESDMWYLFGKIQPIASEQVAINDIFEVTRDLDFKTVISDWSQGYRCELQYENLSIPCLLMECTSHQVSLRMLVTKESIEWSEQNLQALSISRG